MVEVKLLGELGRRFGRSYRFMVRNPREVISALANQLEGFKEYFCEAHEGGIGFKLVNDDPQGMDYEGVLMSCDRLVIAPVIAGSGGNVGRILIGAALIGLAFIPGVGAFSAASAQVIAGTATAGSLTAVGTVLFSLGASMVLTGIAGLLTPPVKTPGSDSKKKDSFMFDRAVELTTQGYPIPVLYGRYLAVSPLTISSAISTETIPV
ncbi:tail protein [Synechococcus phage S-CBS4]|uniref:tail protein n=1 Tax=Synechococcus phage S-CBS4 TaxID=756275 RepID=UPI000246A6FE|nr:tail protein [Synechococcus phage S-CBS4]AEX56005.1 tail assembly protein [Synechococcus phage S-CBS4]